MHIELEIVLTKNTIKWYNWNLSWDTKIQMNANRDLLMNIYKTWVWRHHKCIANQGVYFKKKEYDINRSRNDIG